MLFLILSFLIFVVLACAKTVTYDWEITWVTASPGGFTRPVIGINGEWPCPTVEVDVGDRLVVHVTNSLGNQSTSLHWHGQNQRGTPYMDGTSGVAQCPIPPGSYFTYDFTVAQAGTYWYHSHNMGQFPDGLRGPLIVHDSAAPFAGKYDKELTITLSDWYHKQMPELLGSYESISNANTGGQEPVPDANLINDSINTQIPVEPGKTYLVRIINVGNFAGQAIYFDGHPFTAVEVDGVYVDASYVGSKNIRIATGQRWSFLVNTKNSTSKNFAIYTTLDVNMILPPPGYNPNQTAWLVYDKKKPLPPAPTFSTFDFFDDMSLVPSDHQPLLEPVTHQIKMDTGWANMNGVSRATINNSTYLTQKVPSLYTALTVPSRYTSNPLIYGHVNPYVIKSGDIVEIILNNINPLHNNLHPWHLHGHSFQVLQRSDPNTGAFTNYSNNIAQFPLKRDTIMVNINSHVVIRFRADNPGVWLFHCHIEWHIEAGLVATIIEAPDLLTGMRPPSDHIKACEKYPMKWEGNAAGDVRRPLDNLNGSVRTVPRVMNG
ncbi:MAG: hypothetical protein Q9225_003357 [Loekoesia sp. 1 TL-2023]